MPLPLPLATLVTRQCGVLTRRQALRMGLSPAQVSKWVAQREWVRLHPGVYLAIPELLGPAGQLWAAVLWAGDGAVVSGPAAAWWYGLRDRPAPPTVTVPPRCSPRPSAGVVVRRRVVAPVDRTRARGLPIVGLPLAALETAASEPRGSEVLDRSLRDRVALTDLRRCLDRHRGTTGAAEMSRLLRVAADRTGDTEAEAMRMLVSALRAAGVPGWVRAHPAGPHRIDLAFPDVRVAVGVEGWTWHHGPERSAADRRAVADLVADGWVPVRITWHDLDTDPAGCVHRVLAAIGSRSRVGHR